MDPGSNHDGTKTFSRENFRDDYAGLTLIQMSLNGKRNCVTSGPLENECHLQVKRAHITFTNKAKYNRYNKNQRRCQVVTREPTFNAKNVRSLSIWSAGIEFSCFIRYPNLLHDWRLFQVQPCGSLIFYKRTIYMVLPYGFLVFLCLHITNKVGLLKT